MVPLLGECPVPSQMRFDGLNDGQGAGRACWMVSHSPIKSDGHGATCSRHCYYCDFYKRVVFEQEDSTCFKYSSTDNKHSQ